MSEKLFPAILIALDVAAAVVYLAKGNSNLCVYWMSAAVLTTCVTWRW